ncbi:unnamed protein product [Trifolium pratense]|uniref:Uncharacterized protein n=1 Tax=Trifolium pratense TaxID=57577 RepID=A0ACB0IIV8_TRIPR|nr:unnamed protein product [Trifolium pratense]
MGQYVSPSSFRLGLEKCHRSPKWGTFFFLELLLQLDQDPPTSASSAIFHKGSFRLMQMNQINHANGFVKNPL